VHDIIEKDWNKFFVFLDEAIKICSKYEFCDLISVRFAHRHWELEKEQVMLQMIEEKGDRIAFVTKPWNRKDIPHHSNMVPNTWIIGESSLEPLEYSLDYVSQKVYQTITSKGEFWDEFRSLVLGFEYEGLVALAINNPIEILVNSQQTRFDKLMWREENVDGESILTLEKRPEFSSAEKIREISTWSLRKENDESSFESRSAVWCISPPNPYLH